jgi:pentatricopeptide repeat protein
MHGYFYVKCIGQLTFARFQSYDTALSYMLSAFVRAGNIEGAVKLCSGAHQP